MDARPVILETDRLTLYELEDEDAPFILELLNDPSFIEFIGDRGVRNVDDAVDYIRSGPVESYARYGYGLFLTVRRDDQARIGICGLLKRDELDDPDVGFAFLPRYWSKGYARESAEAILQYGWSTLGMRRIVAITSPGNHSSISLLHKLGLRFEETVRLAEESPPVNLYAVDAQ